MSKVVKKRIKLKKGPLAVFIVCIIIVCLALIRPFSNKEIKKMNLTKKEIKLKQLNNIDKKLDYFNYNYIDRYLAYKKKNKDLDLKDIIVHVNMRIDKPYYTNTKKTPYPNKSYILVNKYYFLDDNYVPDNLESIDEDYARSGMKLVNYAKDAYEKMAKKAKDEGMTLIAMSSYRSYKYQVNLYQKYVDDEGVEAADTYSARPGFSEHQTGLAIDLYNGVLDYTDFEKTDEFIWMENNAYKFGFILRFPKDKTDETGYMYESWHYRYVGKKIAKYIHDEDISFEEYYAKEIENY